jgi:hypothetical protein
VSEFQEIPESIIAKIRRAATFGTYDGRPTIYNRFYMDNATWFHPRSGALVIFTRDTGHHTSGWFKNPDYERCLHLSLSLRDPAPMMLQSMLIPKLELNVPAMNPPLNEMDERIGKHWARALFGDSVRYAWFESPKSASGRALGVMHDRVFCDEAWEPILPRKEVYSKDFTELGWESWSDQGRERPSHVDAD